MALTALSLVSRVLNIRPAHPRTDSALLRACLSQRDQCLAALLTVGSVMAVTAPPRAQPAGTKTLRAESRPRPPAGGARAAHDPDESPRLRQPAGEDGGVGALEGC
jgi:hypothetical protein